ncbi:phosphoglycolate phosphatase [Marinomonas ostreistagni]|uniref:phosphoglycolate phosphatase n=1 Tax=Marinomonas ostreistagni TaxID=359209 RepID=UPI00194F486E|nr:phosphoglycolate phosphatase [Marinomonas ostreistagni]MBM6551477.1 phosphoglycolate phosphatase [Marinomonas ostreistagni]
MSFKDKSVLLFDLDGTLVDSAPDLAAAVNATLVELGREPFPEATVRNWVGNGAQPLISRGLSGAKEIDPNLSESLVTEALEIFLARYEERVCDQSVLYPGVKETLQTLKQRGYRLAIITNKPEKFIAPMLDGLGLNGLFEFALGGDSSPERKPEPLPLYTACGMLNAQLSDCVMIGDSKNDILAAKAAKIASVGVSYGYNYDEDLASYEPEFLFDQFSDLLKVFTPVAEPA